MKDNINSDNKIINNYKSLSIYIHIPFCLYKCNYCDFYSIGLKPFNLLKSNSSKKFQNNKINEIIKSFVNAIENEIDFYSIFFSNYKIKTIYFGGGTPSILDPHIIEHILLHINKRFKIEKKCEITIEANPEDLTEQKISFYKKSGINRISIGIQSFENKDLEFLERRGNNKKNLHAIEIATKHFDNISCDLITGLPYSSVVKNLDILKTFKIQHISIYMLTIYKDLRLYSLIKNKIDKIEEKTVNDYLLALKWCKENGYKQYEISNFAQNRNYFSKHNIVYWKRKPYLGFGPSASGFFKNIRYKNGLLNKYISFYEKKNKIIENYSFKNSCKDKKEFLNFYNINRNYFSEIENLTKIEVEEEFIMLSLRLNKGLSLKEYEKRFHQNFIKEKATILNELLEEKKVKIIDNYLKIVPEYFIFFNDIISKLI